MTIDHIYKYIHLPSFVLRSGSLEIFHQGQQFGVVGMKLKKRRWRFFMKLNKTDMLI